MNNIELYMGIDVGSSGSISLMTPDGKLYSVEKLIKRDKEDDVSFEQQIYDQFVKYEGVNMKVVVERIWSRPGNNSTRAFTSGRMYGSIMTCLVGLGSTAEVEVEHPTPQKWQKWYNWPEKSTKYSYDDWKRLMKDKAQVLFPEEDVTLWKADSLLIANYCFNLYK